MKPLASGCERDGEGRWRNDDALALQAASDPRPAYDDVNPFALPLPIAPEFAARDAGIEVTLPPILAAHARLAAQRSEEHTSELQSLMRISYAVFCLKKKTNKQHIIGRH